jgi:ABC-type branched-subunit amino acid transport system substrate-binding protein
VPAPGQNGASDVGVTATTITLGTVNLASATRSLGPVIAEVTAKTDQAAIDWINIHGGINGRKLQLLVCDDGGDSARGMACYEKLKSQVFAFIPGETLLTETVHTAVDRDHVPYLSWGWFVSEFQSPYMFPCHANGIREATASANWVLDNWKDVKTVGINYLNVSEDIAAKDAAKSIFEQHGVKIVQAIPQEWDSPDESQHVLSQRVANPDVIMIYGWPSSTAKFFHDANGQNWAPRHGYIGNHLTFDPGYGKIYGEYIKDKVIGVTSYVYPPDVTPGNTLWRQVSNQYAGRDLVGLHFKYSMGHHITQASFNCVMVAAKLLGMMGSNVTRPQFVNLLETNQIDTGDGIVLRWPHGNHLQDPYAFNREFMYKWITQADGTFDETRVLPDAFYNKSVDMCQLPKVEDCRAMQPTGTILTGADRFYK